jgi:hypothetical protein
MGARTNSSGGSVRMSAKDASNLVKTVNAINLNLISINKMLQQQYTLESKNKVQQQRKRNLEAENLRRESAETASETTQKIGGFVSKALIQPSKKIIGGIFRLSQGFIKFFTVAFIGWFTKSVAAWFEQDKNTKEQQIKTWTRKITTAIAIAGGVLLAVKIGIPVIMSLMGSVITLTVKSVALLLNPLTWKALLIGGLGALAFEGIARGFDTLMPGEKARRRTASILDDTDRRALETAINASSSRESRMVNGELTDVIRVSPDQLIPTSQIQNLLTEEGPVDIYKEIGGQLVKQGDTPGSQFTITRQTLEDRGFFRKDEGIRQALLSARYRPEFTSAVGAAYKARREYESAAPGDREGKLKVYENLLAKAQALYDKLSVTSKVGLGSVGITRDTLGTSEVFEQGPLEFAMGKLGRDIINSPLVSSISGLSKRFEEEFDQFNKKISDALIVNVTNNAIVEQFQDDETPGEIPGLGQISPFDLNNPWILEAMKTYQLTSA